MDDFLLMVVMVGIVGILGFWVFVIDGVLMVNKSCDYCLLTYYLIVIIFIIWEGGGYI